MPGRLRLWWRRRLLLLTYKGYGFNLNHTALGNQMLLTRNIGEKVIGPAGDGLAARDNPASIVKFHEIFVRTTAKDAHTEQECKSSFTLEDGSAHFRR